MNFEDIKHNWNSSFEKEDRLDSEQIKEMLKIKSKSNTALKKIGLRDNPDLQEVCVWTTPFPPEGVYRWIFGPERNEKMYFTTECGKKDL